MNTWYSGLYKAFMYASVIAFIIGFCTTDATSLGAYLAGYSVLVLSISIILVELFIPILSTSGSPTAATMYALLLNTGPLLLLLGIIGFILYMIIINRPKIIEGDVSSSFQSFNTILVFLMFCQLYLLSNQLSTDQYKMTKKISPVTMSLIYFLVLLSGICSSILYVILNYYTTDG